MNLLDKTWKLLLVVVAVSIFSCEDPASEIGLGLNSDALLTEVAYADITLTADNIFIDSLRTSNNGRLMLGRIQDEIFGTTTASALMRLSASSTGVQDLEFEMKLDTLHPDLSPLRVDTLWQRYVFDKAWLNLEIEYGHGQFIANPQTYYFHLLDEELVSGVYYLADFETRLQERAAEDAATITLNEDLLKSAIEYAGDTSFTYVERLNLSNSYYDMFIDIFSQDDISGELSERIHGLAIVPDENNDVMLGILPGGKTNIEVRYFVYQDEYRFRKNEDGTVVELEESERFSSAPIDTVVMTLSLNNLRYSQITTDRSGSLMGDYTDNSPNAFDIGDGNVYLNPITGIYPKVSLQPVIDFFNTFDEDAGEFIQINRAQFYVGTDVLNQGEYVNLNDNFRFLFPGTSGQIRARSLITPELQINAGILRDNSYLTGDQQILAANLSYDSLDSHHLYQATMTVFTQRLKSINSMDEEERLDLGLNLEDEIVLMPTDVTSANRTIFSSDSIKLRLYYTQPNR